MTAPRITREENLPDEFDPVAIAKWREESRKRLAGLHPADCFRLMFGLPPLPENQPTPQDQTGKP